MPSAHFGLEYLTTQVFSLARYLSISLGFRLHIEASMLKTMEYDISRQACLLSSSVIKVYSSSCF